MISQITPEGFSPASRATSTAASVWPARTSTPPSRAASGKTWPGVTIWSRPLAASIATETVRARSAAEMPVVTPSLASIEMVKAVSSRVSLWRGIMGRPSCSTRSAVSARQISPRPCLAMKLIASGVAICAGTTRSPSFSRSSSSTRMNMRPLRASSMICSAEAITPRRPPARNFSSFTSVSAVGFQSESPSLRKLLGWRPAARARPARLISPLSTSSLRRSIKTVLMVGGVSHQM